MSRRRSKVGMWALDLAIRALLLSVALGAFSGEWPREHMEDKGGGTMRAGEMCKGRVWGEKGGREGDRFMYTREMCS